jgi:hypothetical protein
MVHWAGQVSHITHQPPTLSKVNRHCGGELRSLVIVSAAHPKRISRPERWSVGSVGRWAAGRQGDMASPTDAGWTPGENVPDMYRGKGGHVTSQAFHMLGNLLVNMQGVDVRRFVICFPQFDEFMRSPASGGKPTKKYAISRMVASIAGVNAGASELTA